MEILPHESAGANRRSLGIIQSASAAACRLFGYNRMALEKRSINILIPSPLAEVHDFFLERAITTGEPASRCHAAF